jgi:TolA-binding protein
MAMSEPLENLMARARRGELRADERTRLQIGLNASLEAALLYQAGCGFEDERVVEPGDETLLQRLAASTAERYGHSPRAARRLAPAAIVALWFATSLAAAAGLGAAYFTIHRWPQAGRDRARPAVSQSVPQSVLLTPETAPKQEVVVGGTVVPNNRQSLAQAPPNRSARPAARPAADGSGPTAKSLFRRANEARSDGRVADAVREYQQLQQEFPKSREAELATISLGLLELQRGNAQAALTQFHRAHVEYPSPEALWGEAQVLRDLGRFVQERELLEELLGRYPGSPYAAAANKRLAVQD